MPLRSISKFLGTASLAALSFANGTEQLGAPTGITIQPASRSVSAGVGLIDGQPDNISIAVPAGATIRQVLVYWEGLDWAPTDHGPTATLTIGGTQVTGSRIGGPSDLFGDSWSSTFRADVSALGVVAPGNNSVSISGHDFTRFKNGAGLVVLYDDALGGGTVTLFDGNDVANPLAAPPFHTTAPVTFTFPASAQARTFRASMMFAPFWPDRASVITFHSGGSQIDVLFDAIYPSDGNSWCTLAHDVLIPAGATDLTIQALPVDSGLGQFAGNGLQKFSWVNCSLRSEAPGGEPHGCTPGYWKNHTERWDGVGTNDKTATIKTYLLFNATMGVTSTQSSLSNSLTLLGACKLKGGQLKALARHAAAALANADSSIGYPYTVAQVIALYRDAVGADPGPETWESAKAKLEAANELGCPLN
jgi:hypothetical protein